MIDYIQRLKEIAETNYDDDIIKPTREVLSYTEFLIKEYLVPANIHPSRVTPLGDGGMCLVFKNKSLEMYMEFYNDGEKGFIVRDAKNNQSIENKDLYSLYDIIQHLDWFYKK